MDGDNETNSTDEIEVTPEMVEAGVDEIAIQFMELRRPSDQNIFEEVVRAIFLAMHRAKRKSLAVMNLATPIEF